MVASPPLAAVGHIPPAYRQTHEVILCVWRDQLVLIARPFPASPSLACIWRRNRHCSLFLGCSYHYISDGPNSPEAYGGARMVHSAVTETLANVCNLL